VTTTAELVEQLAAGIQPAPRAYVPRRLGLGIGAGVLIAAVLTFWLWGPRADFMVATGTMPFWVKFAFSAALGAAGLVAAIRLARPDGTSGWVVWWVGLVLVAMAGGSAAQMAAAPAAQERMLMMGGTAAVCPWLILALSLPILGGALWAMRGLAPTRLTLAGAAAGLAAGGLSAFVYAISCGETGVMFVLLWYGLGIAVPTLLGAALGPRMLRW
jgi:hypothetical protein